MIGRKMTLMASSVVFVVLTATTGLCEPTDTTRYEPKTVHVFYENVIHFSPDDSSAYATPLVTAQDNGRVIVRKLKIDKPEGPVAVVAHLRLRPIPKDERTMYDRWDRAGNVRLSSPGGPDIEVVKFITAYGGETSYEIDITHLVSRLNGWCTFKGFVDTWVSPAWKMDFSIEFRPVPDPDAPAWVEGVLYEESVSEESLRDGPKTVDVTIPEGMSRVVMHYLSTGHCTDGRGADEFQSKDNVIWVGGKEVYRFKPWRDDCLRFRTINPYCARWADGSWSSDYSRSGWCPGDEVLPVAIDLTDILTPGRHTIGFAIENVRPRGEDNHLGYWRVSSHLLGWKE
ncbi:MAG: hypothetical protein JSW50_12800 [Candidatus Latescibacterota bacterium]|nr:MAG: hypothetical protein JSW50_12800 [Candidatus Latescibacterota bacterium]